MQARQWRPCKPCIVGVTRTSPQMQQAGCPLLPYLRETVVSSARSRFLCRCHPDVYLLRFGIGIWDEATTAIFNMNKPESKHMLETSLPTLG